MENKKYLEVKLNILEENKEICLKIPIDRNFALVSPNGSNYNKEIPIDEIKQKIVDNCRMSIWSNEKEHKRYESDISDEEVFKFINDIYENEGHDKLLYVIYEGGYYLNTDYMVYNVRFDYDYLLEDSKEDVEDELEM